MRQPYFTVSVAEKTQFVILSSIGNHSRHSGRKAEGASIGISVRIKWIAAVQGVCSGQRNMLRG